MNSRTSRTTAAALAVGAVLLTSGCLLGGEDSPAPAAVPCAVAADATTSDDFLAAKAPRLVSRFLTDNTCATVTVRAISNNSVGESCTAPEVRLDTLRAAADNVDARRSEIQTRIVPQVTSRITTVTDCVRAADRGRGTDVVGALIAIAELSGSAPHVLTISDLVQNVGVDLQNRDLADPAVAATATTELTAALRPLTGWQITLGGLGAGTTYLTPAHSAALHQVWEGALTAKGATITQVGV
ncbi:MAG: hypothetical protein QM662_06465 [Gordonia sp. (in: high G+C Gram-positive bacteria)]